MGSGRRVVSPSRHGATLEPHSKASSLAVRPRKNLLSGHIERAQPSTRYSAGWVSRNPAIKRKQIQKWTTSS